jgi:ABC-type sugar transport system ATPase subunit
MIALVDVAVRAGAFAIEGVRFEVPAGGYAVLMGKTGSGKTTILEAICGLRPVERGRILLRDRDVSSLPPAGRAIGYVPQDRALFQTMTVRENLAFGPTLRRWTRADIAARVDELAGLLGIAKLLDRKPRGLSGGEAQRVALGRALAARPDVLCMDEPLTALDDDTREEMFTLLHSVKKLSNVTTLHVTHSREEARRLADKVLVVRDGAVRDVAMAELEEARG